MSFCSDYCLSAVWHGGDQPVTLLRCDESPGCFDSGLHLICNVEFGICLPFDNIP